MVLTPSTMLPLGTELPFFDLAVVSGIELRSGDERSGLERIDRNKLSKKPLLLMILCAHCPFVRHIEAELTQLDKKYGNRVQIFAIASNSLITHPQDAPINLLEQAVRNYWKFPYLLDLDQCFVKALKAACTPDFFLFSSEKDGPFRLQYRGQLDDSRPGNNVKVTGKDLRLALDSVLEDKVLTFDQKPSIGCNIKWHPGGEPPWFG